MSSIAAKFTAAFRLLAVLCLLLCASLLASAQQNQYDRGTPPQHAAGVSQLGSYASADLGTVNLSNGSLNLKLPLGSIGGRGFWLPLSLNYSSKVWSATTDTDQRRDGSTGTVAFADFDRGLNAVDVFSQIGAGWTVGAAPMLNVKTVRIGRITSGPNVGCYTYSLTKLTAVLPDRGEIEFRDDNYDGAPLPSDCSGYTTTANRGTRWHATDGSGAIYIRNAEGNGGVLITANGTRYNFTGERCNLITDRNGNFITIDYVSHSGSRLEIVYTDQLRRITSVRQNVADPQTGAPLALLVTLPGYGGSRYIKIKSGPMNQNYRDGINPATPVWTGDWDPSSWGYAHTGTKLFDHSYGLYAQRVDDAEVLSEIGLPDGRSLSFRYNEFGEVAEVQLPTGGKVEYDYEPVLSLPSGTSPLWETNGDIRSDIDEVDRAVVLRRTYPDGSTLEGTWDYSYGAQSTIVQAHSAAGALLLYQNHVFLPAGRYTEYTLNSGSHDGTHYTLWSTGVERRTETLDANSAVISAVEQDWAQRAPVAWSTYPQEQPANDNRVGEARRYLDTGAFAKTVTDYDDANYPRANNVHEVKEYDFDQALKRRTVNTYVTGAYQTDDSIHLLNLLQQQSVYAPNGVTELARAVNEYDVYDGDGNHPPFQDYGAVIGHDSGYGTGRTARGNVTASGAWLNTNGQVIYSYTGYDTLGNPVSSKDPRGKVTNVSYADDFGDGSDPGGGAAGANGQTYALPTLVTSPPPNPGEAQHTARSQYDFSTGLLTGFRGRNGVVTQTIYNDPYNRPTLVKSALGVTGVESHAKFYYAPATVFGITLTGGDMLTASEQTSTDDFALRSWTHTDGFGRAVENWSRDPQGDVKVATVYDGLGRVRQRSNPYRPSLSEPALYTTTAYDIAGRVSSVTTPDAAAVSTYYKGNLVLVKDQQEKERLSRSDALGRLTDVWEITPADQWTEQVSFPDRPEVAAGYRTVYEYDLLDNLKTVTQGTQPPRNFQYDSLKRLTSAENPESGTVNFKYDEVGSLKVKTDERGASTHYEYDALNRSTRRWYNGSNALTATTHNSPALPAGVGATAEIRYFYDAQVLPAGAPTFDRGGATGRLVATTYGGSAGSYLGYDVAGRPSRNIQQTGGVNYQVGPLSYNLAGAVTSMSYPSGRTVTTSYDVAGRPSGVVGNLGDDTQRSYSSEVTYSPFGGIRQERFGTQTPLYHKLHYNRRGQLYDIRLSTQSLQANEWDWNRGAILNYYSGNYAWEGNPNTLAGTDNNGNLRRQQHLVPGDDQTSSYTFKQQTYEYDWLNRLSSVVEAAGTNLNVNPDSFKQAYDYDRWGNRTINAAATQVYELNANYSVPEPQFTVAAATNRLGVPAGRSEQMDYDAAGNLTLDTYQGGQGGGGTRAYDAENRMTSAEFLAGQTQTASYVYDADGRRVKRMVGTSAEAWQVYGIGGELLAEYAPGAAPSQPQKEYGYRGGELLVTAEPGAGQQQQPPPQQQRANVALASSGATAAASSQYSASFPAASAINGDRYHLNAAGGVYNEWHSATGAAKPDWLEVTFDGPRTIDEIDLFTQQDDYNNPVDPSEQTTFSAYGLTAFEVQYWTGSQWAAVPGGSVSGNNKVWRKFTFPAVVTTKVRVSITASADGYSRVFELEAWGWEGRSNVALAANGGTATASSSYNTPPWVFTPAGANDGDRRGANWGSGGGWNDATGQDFQDDWLEVAFDGAKTIDEIDVFTGQDNYANPSEPADGQTFALYGLTGFSVQYWTGSAWATVQGGGVSGNDKVWRKFSFPAVTTTKVRVRALASADGYSRLAELEAWGMPATRSNYALASNGGVATASSSYNTPPWVFTPAGANDGDRRGANWGSGGGWNDATGGAFPDLLEVEFDAAKSIDEIDVFTGQDSYASPAEPTESMTFTQYGLTHYEVQYKDGANWVTVQGGGVTSNNKVWRKFTFPAVVTTGVRVRVTGSADGYSRVTELEAWGGGGGGGAAAADVRWLVTDQLGTPRMVVDKTGSLSGVTRHDYLPFGEELFDGTGGRTTTQGYGVADNLRQKFTQQERDTETGLDYFSARFFASPQGRFTGVDPYNIIVETSVKAEVNLDEAQTLFTQYLLQPRKWNRYAYAINNPLKYVDPTGEEIELTGETEQDRADAFERFKVVVDPSARGLLYVKKVKSGGKTHYYIKYKEGFGNAGPLEAKIAKMIDHSNVAEFKVAKTTQELNDTYQHSGAVTKVVDKGTQTMVHPDAGNIGTEAILRGRRNISSDGAPYIQTNENVDAHEMGHAYSAMFDPCPTDPKNSPYSMERSLEFENYTRRRHGKNERKEH